MDGERVEKKPLSPFFSISHVRAVHVVDVTIPIVIQPVAGNLLLIHPQVGGQVRVSVVQAAVHDANRDTSRPGRARPGGRRARGAGQGGSRPEAEVGQGGLQRDVGVVGRGRGGYGGRDVGGGSDGRVELGPGDV